MGYCPIRYLPFAKIPPATCILLLTGVSLYSMDILLKTLRLKEGMPTNIIYGLYKDKWNRVWAQNTSDQLIAFKDGKIEKKYNFRE